MSAAIGKNRPRDLAYAMRWLDIWDAEDIVHDAYEVALRRWGRPTSLRLAIKQCVGRFVAARARGWTALGEQVERLPSDEVSIGERLDLRRALATCNSEDVAELIETAPGARAPSRAVARRIRLARRRVRCQIETC